MQPFNTGGLPGGTQPLKLPTSLPAVKPEAKPEAKSPTQPLTGVGGQVGADQIMVKPGTRLRSAT